MSFVETQSFCQSIKVTSNNVDSINADKGNNSATFYFDGSFSLVFHFDNSIKVRIYSWARNPLIEFYVYNDYTYTIDGIQNTIYENTRKNTSFDVFVYKFMTVVLLILQPILNNEKILVDNNGNWGPFFKSVVYMDIDGK
ncbi:hypothetical protein U3516DRAFT_789814 [Neocallimastix sp. 'constans']